MSDSEDEPGGQGQDQDWDDWNDESPAAATRDVLDHEMSHESVEVCLSHCATKYNWDLMALAKSLRLDIYGSIRLVTWIRRQVAAKRKDLEDAQLIEHLKAPFKDGARPPLLDDDELLFPYLPDDPLLPALALELGGDDEDEDAGGRGEASAQGGGGEGSDTPEALRKENERLREELKRQQELIEAAKTTMLGGADADDSDSSTDDETPAKGGGRGQPGGGGGESAGLGARVEKPMKKSERSYFDSYSKIGIHHEMLSDSTRTGGYRDFLCNNPSLIRDKVVLDVGCGTGILCMFAARAGAKQVIGIDMSDIIDDAREIVRANGFEDKITLIKGKVEEVTLPVDKVDVIVSEWMGYFLLYESMMDSVVWARDKYLRPGGVCMPDKMVMKVALLNDDARLNFWDDVYGFDMQHIKKKVRARYLKDPMVEHYEPKQLVSKAVNFKEFDCQRLVVKDLEFAAPFKVWAAQSGRCDALCTWFDTHFLSGCDSPVSFTTGPVSNMEEATHWKQTAFYLDGGLEVKEGDVVEGVIHCHRAKNNPRHLDVIIEWTHVPADGPKGQTKHQSFELH